jgi:hypothetical protein
MLERLEKYNSDQDVTFSCHGKGVRRSVVGSDDPHDHIFQWIKAMYEVGFSWNRVEAALKTHGACGAFRRVEKRPRAKWGPWHYSGTFFWWRNQDVFRRNWRGVPRHFYGVEAWPGLIFATEEAACLVGDNIGDLYGGDYWKRHASVAMQEWRQRED